MPRRIPDYPDAFECWNYISTSGALVSGASIIIFVLSLVLNLLSSRSVRKIKINNFIYKTNAKLSSSMTRMFRAVLTKILPREFSIWLNYKW